MSRKERFENWKQEVAAILLIVSLGYWFRMGQRWADHVIESWKELIQTIKTMLALKKMEKEQISKEDEEF